MAVFDGTAWQTYEVPGYYNISGEICGMAVDTAGHVNWVFNCGWSSRLDASMQVGYNLLRQAGPDSAADDLIASGLFMQMLLDSFSCRDRYLAS